MSNVITFPGSLAAPTVADEILQILRSLAERPPTAHDAFFASKVTELQTNIDHAITEDDMCTAYLRMGVLLGIGIVALQPEATPKV
ncbi:hypothetical protein J2J97_02440 [Rhizobium bangladeshense]|uniref:hypothetical protein n=1 Tax=Rhizobium bangladeshense TaxID=1138189 RepID=UPI001A99147F|nr:hypothetical protein [Rhizobium bangladeshense]QSY94825.1 hypothetical protein J2J97_02440 [Rhizobium bangladeshense]